MVRIAFSGESSVKKDNWEHYELEYLESCPICGSDTRTSRFSGIKDRTSGTQGQWDYYQCQDCGVFYIDPRPTEETIVRAYNDYFTHSVDKERERVAWIDQIALRVRNDYLNWKYGHHKVPTINGGRWLMYLLPPWLRLEWDHYARHLPKPKPTSNRLLDVGCGNGQFLTVAQSAGWKCHGVDFDPKAVERAKGYGCQVALGSLEQQLFPGDFFDAITLSHVIEHIHRPKDLLKECVRVLKPGGTLWVATPNAASFIQKWFKRNWLAYSPPHHLILFKPESLRRLIEELGLSAHLEHKGLHVQSHWRASKSLQEGRTGLEDVYLDAFTGRQMTLRYWFVQLLAWIFPSIQGDVIIRATKR
jgi:2-polyprenyl-3-methyl-5-hydroxy-6-metoxy-1,4-benzoquinol methylase